MTVPLVQAAATATGPTPLLQALELKAGYQRRQVLYDISLSVGPGEVVAVLGHNGAGKTTLLKAIIGFIPIFGGRIFFDGVDRSAQS
jgi:urea transport system ATP-binding protein